MKPKPKPTPPKDLWERLADIERHAAIQIPERKPNQFTRAEYQEKNNYSKDVAMQKISVMIKNGLLRPCKVMAKNCNGAWSPIAAYELVD